MGREGGVGWQGVVPPLTRTCQVVLDTSDPVFGPHFPRNSPGRFNQVGPGPCQLRGVSSTGHSERLRTRATEAGGALENGGPESRGEAGFGGRKGRTQRRKVEKVCYVQRLEEAGSLSLSPRGCGWWVCSLVMSPSCVAGFLACLSGGRCCPRAG